MKRQILTAVTISGLLMGASQTILVGCGSDNIFASASKKDDKDKGKSALANGDYAAAIDYLDDYVKAHPEDAAAHSMLATAYMKQIGVDELQLAGKIVDVQKSQSNSDWNAIVAAMPAGSTQNVENLEKAVDALKTIPEAQRTPEQNYQLAIASASLAVTVVKQNVADGSGSYSPTAENLAKISEEEATLVVSSIATTATALVASGVASGDGAAKLSEVSGKIEAQPGTTDLDKLKAFLAKQ